MWSVAHYSLLSTSSLPLSLSSLPSPTLLCLLSPPPQVLPPVVDRLAVTLHLNSVQKKELSAGKTHNFWQACVYELSILNITVSRLLIL